VTGPDPRTIAIVLDTTAVTAWVRGSVAVGELLIEVDAERGAALIPLACLVESAHQTAMLDRARLELLVDHPATVLVADNPEDWQALTVIRALVDRPDLASAAMLALDGEVDVFTREAAWYAEVAGGRIVLEFDD
jgi:hypothetical protein